MPVQGCAQVEQGDVGKAALLEGCRDSTVDDGHCEAKVVSADTYHDMFDKWLRAKRCKARSWPTSPAAPSWKSRPGLTAEPAPLEMVVAPEQAKFLYCNRGSPVVAGCSVMSGPLVSCHSAGSCY